MQIETKREERTKTDNQTQLFTRYEHFNGSPCGLNCKNTKVS